MAETVNSSSNVPNRQAVWRRNRASWFACILYPDEDSNHKAFMSYLEKNRVLYPKFIYIDHYKDIYVQYDLDHWEENHKDESPPDLGSLKKRHIHFLFKRKNACPESTVQNYFSCWIHHVEAVRDYESYVQYMLHNDPSSISRGKPSYHADELRGDLDMIQEAIIQNAKSVLFDQLLDIISVLSEGNLLELYEVLRRDSPEYFEVYKRIIKENAYIINSLVRGREKRLENEFRSRFFDSTLDSETKEALHKLYHKGILYRY